MVVTAVLVFVLGYIFVAIEQRSQFDKAGPALITGVVLWTLYFWYAPDVLVATESLNTSLSEIAGIVFFILGAMTIVEIIDSHGGFDIITNNVTTKKKTTLLMLIGFITFFLSAVLDNLTTAIVMSSLILKLLDNKEDRLMFAGLVIIAANAGGAWSPIGDITTTMLWIGNQITAAQLMVNTFIPSLMVLVIPLIAMLWQFRGQTIAGKKNATDAQQPPGAQKLVLCTGIALLLFVPVFKSITHLPPFMGMILSLGLMWLLTSQLHKRKDEDVKIKLSVQHALRKIDSPSILFFLGILLAVSALHHFGILHMLAIYLNTTFSSTYVIGSLLGLLSSVIDNVPLVAAVQGMYPLTELVTDHYFWHFLALTAGTGGSCIIIGSAAGVVMMGLQNMNFLWYIKKISWLAIMGYLAGILTFIGQRAFLNCA